MHHVQVRGQPWPHPPAPQPPLQPLTAGVDKVGGPGHDRLVGRAARGGGLRQADETRCRWVSPWMGSTRAGSPAAMQQRQRSGKQALPPGSPARLGGQVLGLDALKDLGRLLLAVEEQAHKLDPLGAVQHAWGSGGGAGEGSGGGSG